MYAIMPGSRHRKAYNGSQEKRNMLADTQIKMAGGGAASLSSLKQSRKGYRVLSYDLAGRKITHAFSYGAKRHLSPGRMLTVTLNTFEQVTCTEDQVFCWANGEPKRAKELKPGSQLLSVYASPPVTVRSVEEAGSAAEAYSLPVFEGEAVILCAGGLVTKAP